MNDAGKTGVAHACATQVVLEEEAVLAERMYHHHISLVNDSKMRYLAAQKKIVDLSEKLDMLYTVTISSIHPGTDSHWTRVLQLELLDSPDSRKLNMPSPYSVIY